MRRPVRRGRGRRGLPAARPHRRRGAPRGRVRRGRGDHLAGRRAVRRHRVAAGGLHVGGLGRAQLPPLGGCGCLLRGGIGPIARERGGVRVGADAALRPGTGRRLGAVAGRLRGGSGLAAGVASGSAGGAARVRRPVWRRVRRPAWRRVRVRRPGGPRRVGHGGRWRGPAGPVAARRAVGEPVRQLPARTDAPAAGRLVQSGARI